MHEDILVIYGERSYIGNSFKSYLETKPVDVITVGSKDCDYTYLDFEKDIPLDKVKYLVYATGRAQVPNSKVENNLITFDINTFQFFDLIERIEDRLDKDASIVYISSGHSVRASDINPYYASSKAAVNSFVVSYSKKFAKMNLKDGGTRRINALAPEAIDSPMIDRMVGLDNNVNMISYVATRPNYRLLDVEEVLHPLYFLLSNKSTGVNGQVLVLGGVK